MSFRKRILLLVVLTPVLSSCSFFAPGMQMTATHLTPVVNSHNQIVKPQVIPISAELIQHEMNDAQLAKRFALKHYVPPIGFSANIRTYHYRVSPQDVLQIAVWNESVGNASVPPLSANNLSPAMNMNESAGVASTNSNFIVNSNGFIFYPYLGNLLVAGKTATQIRHLITNKMSRFFKNPQVTVNIAKFNGKHVAVTGAVKQPTMLPVTNVPLNVLTAVTQAGGPIRCGIQSSGDIAQTCADLHNVQITRGHATVNVDLNHLTAINGSSTNWILKDGDIVYVPNNNESRVFVLGQVTAPGAYNMIDGEMTLREAIGDAKGMSQGANPRYTYIIRNYLREPRLYALNLRSPDALNLAGDFYLKPGDVVFVSTSALHDFNAVMNEITPTLLTAVSIKSLSR